MKYKDHHVCGLESLLYERPVWASSGPGRSGWGGRLHPSQVNPLPCHPSPDTTMSLPKSLGLALAACVCVAAARQPSPNLYDNCEFTVDHSRYDLCPLFHDRGRGGVVKVLADLAPAIQLSYEMSFSGPLSSQSGEEAEPQVRTAGATGPCALPFINESGLMVFSVPFRHMDLFERQVFTSIYRQRTNLLFQSARRTLKIRKTTSPKPSRSLVTLRSTHPALRLLPASRLALIEAHTMVCPGVNLTTVRGDQTSLFRQAT